MLSISKPSNIFYLGVRLSLSNITWYFCQFHFTAILVSRLNIATPSKILPSRLALSQKVNTCFGQLWKSRRCTQLLCCSKSTSLSLSNRITVYPRSLLRDASSICCELHRIPAWREALKMLWTNDLETFRPNPFHCRNHPICKHLSLSYPDSPKLVSDWSAWLVCVKLIS